MIAEDFVPQELPRRSIAMVLAGGRGSRLHELTDRRVKPAVFFGGKFRIIDFVLSNCINSGIRRIGVMTQYKSHSLLRHLQRGWSFLRADGNEFIDLLPAQQRISESLWYRGTADAVYQNLDIVRSHAPDYVVVLAGDHVYKMNYGRMLAFHVEKGAPCTVGCIEVPREEASAFGVIAVDENLRIKEFVEKPSDPPAMPGKPDIALASMGIYVFDWDYLVALLGEDAGHERSSHDFGKDLIPAAVRRGDAAAHPFALSCVSSAPEAECYWRDVGTIDAYWSANVDLTGAAPPLDMYHEDWPILTHQEQLPAAKFVFDDEDRRGLAADSLVSGGCIISGGTVRRSLLFSKCRVHSWSTIEDSVLLPEVEVGRNVRLRKVVVDRGCRLPEGIVIGEDPEVDARYFRRTEGGVTLVTAEMLTEAQRRSPGRNT